MPSIGYIDRKLVRLFDSYHDCIVVPTDICCAYGVGLMPDQNESVPSLGDQENAVSVQKCCAYCVG